MAAWFWIGCGGFCGAIARYGLSTWAQRTTAVNFPVGTLLVNVLGCCAIGALMAVNERHTLAPELRWFLATGLLGALTTFSTFGLETMELLRRGSWWLAAGNVFGNCLLGLLGVTVGWGVIRAMG